MPEYNCERCLKDFKQKSHYDKHLNKKIPKFLIKVLSMYLKNIMIKIILCF